MGRPPSSAPVWAGLWAVAVFLATTEEMVGAITSRPQPVRPKEAAARISEQVWRIFRCIGSLL
ncbi:hypothetical protein D3C86_1974670 [compost metagenome]